jgi:hypothetical protein
LTISRELWRVSAKSKATAVVFVTPILSDCGYCQKELAKQSSTTLYNKAAKQIPLLLTNFTFKVSFYQMRL